LNPYGAAVALRNRLYDTGRLRARHLAWPVVSVGNLRVGGSGKTPFVIHLGELLQARQRAFDVLSRGYGRKDTTIRIVDERGNAQTYGDEPLLIARKLHVPVIVGANRYAAGVYAEQMFTELKPAHGSTWIHLLDDGFQHRRLARAFDIVLVTDTDIDDKLLPRGRLREPVTSLERADAVVVSEHFDASRLGSLTGEKLVWRIRRTMDLPAETPKRVVAFCGIARSDIFFRELEARGLELAARRAFRDHHTYSSTDVYRLRGLFNDNRAKAFITTEKDFINLESAGLAAKLQPLFMATLKTELLEPEAAVDTILSRLKT